MNYRNFLCVMVFFLLAVIAGNAYCDVSYNFALPSAGATYSYPPTWPGMPQTWDDAYFFKMNNGIKTASVNDSVIAENKPICVLFDLGRDRDVNSIVISAVDTPFAWGLPNTVKRADIYLKTAVAGPFHGGLVDGGDFSSGFLVAEANDAYAITVVDKNDSIWTMSSGVISARARYVAVYLTGDDGQFVAADEIEIFGSLSSCYELWEFGLGMPEDLNHDCVVNFADFSMLGNLWLTQMDPANGSMDPNINFASPEAGGSYAYARVDIWPREPRVWPDTTPNATRLTDGYYNSDPNDGNNLVIAENVPLLAMFDLGKDYPVSQVIVYSCQDLWNINGANGMRVFLKSEANGPFLPGPGFAQYTGGSFHEDYLSADADVSFTFGPANKSNPIWTISGDTSNAVARYVAVYVTGTSGLPFVEATEIKIFGHVDSCEQLWSLGFGMQIDLNHDCLFDMKDLQILVDEWLVDSNL